MNDSLFKYFRNELGKKYTFRELFFDDDIPAYESGGKILTDKLKKEGQKQIEEYIKKGSFLSKEDSPVLAIIPIERFNGKDADIKPSQEYVYKSGVNKWKRRIKAGERPFILIGYSNWHKDNRTLDGHHRLTAYEQLGIKDIPVIDRNRKVTKKLENGDKIGGFDDSKKNPIFVNKNVKNEISEIISGTRDVTGGATIQATLIYLRRNEGTGETSKRTKPNIRFEEDKLKKFVDENSLWYTKILDDSNYIDRGVEQLVYKDRNSDIFVVKTNNFIFYNSWEEYLINLLLHNYFFPKTFYELIGFKQTDRGKILPVVRQPFIERNQPTDLKEVEDFLKKTGFVRVYPEFNVYENKDLGIIMGDLHEGNVLTKDEILYFIDTKFFLNDDKYVAKNGVKIQDFDDSKKTRIFVNKNTKHEIGDIVSGSGKVRHGDAIQAVAVYLRGIKESIQMAERTELNKKEETKKLAEYVDKNNLWVDVDLSKRGAEGMEQQILALNDTNVTKLNSGIFYSSWLDYFYSLLLHNYFFPDTAYILVGFYKMRHLVLPVVGQPFIKATQETDLREVKKFLEDNGFKNTKRNDYYNEELGIILEDLHEENVLTKDGILYFIDTVFFLKEKKKND